MLLGKSCIVEVRWLSCCSHHKILTHRTSTERHLWALTLEVPRTIAVQGEIDASSKQANITLHLTTKSLSHYDNPPPPGLRIDNRAALHCHDLGTGRASHCSTVNHVLITRPYGCLGTHGVDDQHRIRLAHREFLHHCSAHGRPGRKRY